jgi:6-pyruvoyltetrahydropterin/6-carboxytetrahydropterin synthase
VTRLHEIAIGKENMKFSSAHFTLLPDRLERLHGHNYRLVVTLRAPHLRDGLLLDFALVKHEARRLCAELDERLLLPGACAELRIDPDGDALVVQCRGKRYVIPAEDCRVLPIHNVSCECLAEYVCATLVAQLRPQLVAAGVVAVAATVEESPGQSGRCEELLGS